MRLVRPAVEKKKKKITQPELWHSGKIRLWLCINVSIQDSGDCVSVCVFAYVWGQAAWFLLTYVLGRVGLTLILFFESQVDFKRFRFGSVLNWVLSNVGWPDFQNIFQNSFSNEKLYHSIIMCSYMIIFLL